MPRISLVADDLRASRELVGRWLEELGYKTDVAANGDSAWETVLERQPDLAVTDIEMPGKSGLELLRQIREHSNERIRSMPVVVISSLNDVALESAVLGLGATAVLSKPLVKTEFQKIIGEIDSEGSEPSSISDTNADSNEVIPGPISPTLRHLVSRARLKRTD